MREKRETSRECKEEDTTNPKSNQMVRSAPPLPKTTPAYITCIISMNIKCEPSAPQFHSITVCKS